MKTELANRISLVEGDLTLQDVDAIVNAANTSLLGGGGVDGAIHRAAGPQLLTECETLGGCPTGSAKITKGYNLKARHVIHAVGPVYHGGTGGEPELLAGCYRTAMKLAHQNGCDSIAFPAISCGVYGYPIIQAAKIAFREVIDFLTGHDRPGRVIFVLFNSNVYQTYQQVWQTICDAAKQA